MNYVIFVYSFSSLCVNFFFLNFILDITEIAEAISKIKWSRNCWWIKETHILDCKCCPFWNKNAPLIMVSFQKFVIPLNFVLSRNISAFKKISFLYGLCCFLCHLSFQDKQLKSESSQHTDSAILAEHKKKEREAAKKGKQPFYLSKSTVIHLNLFLSLSLYVNTMIHTCVCVCVCEHLSMLLGSISNAVRSAMGPGFTLFVHWSISFLQGNRAKTSSWVLKRTYKPKANFFF